MTLTRVQRGAGHLGDQGSTQLFAEARVAVSMGGEPRRAARYEMRGLTSLAAARASLKPPAPDCGSECFPHLEQRPSSSFQQSAPSALGMEGARGAGADGRARGHGGLDEARGPAQLEPRGCQPPRLGQVRGTAVAAGGLWMGLQLGLRTVGEFWVSKFKEEDGKVHLHFFLQSSRLFTVGLVLQCAVKCRIKYETSTSQPRDRKKDSPSVRLRPGRR